MHDLVIRAGTLVDGTGAAARNGDLAIDGDRIRSAMTIQSGQGIHEDAEPTSALPGRQRRR